MASAKARAKRHDLIKKSAWGGRLTPFDSLNYKESLVRLFAEFSEVEADVKRKLAVDYWHNQGLSVANFSKAPDLLFAQVGPLVYVKSQNISLQDREEGYINSQYFKIKGMIEPKVNNVQHQPVAKKVPQEDPNQQVALSIAEKVDYAIDAFILSKGKIVTDIRDYFKAEDKVNPKALSLAKSYFIPLSIELQTALKDPDLKEAWGLSPREFTKFHDFISFIINAFDNYRAVIKVKRPRAKKAKSPIVIAAKVKFQKEDAELGVKSLTPDKIVGSAQVWLYNTKYRRLFLYEALDGETLTIKGTTIQNFDPAKSGSKIIRKPDVMTKEMLPLPKRSLYKAYMDIKGAVGVATGRISEDVLIVRVF